MKYRLGIHSFHVPEALWLQKEGGLEYSVPARTPKLIPRVEGQKPAAPPLLEIPSEIPARIPGKN